MSQKISKLDFHQTPFAGKIAAVYVRVSSNEIKRGNKEKKERAVRESVETQEADGIACAVSNKWDYRVFKNDCNMSGFEDINRPDLSEILRLIKEGKIHTVICRDPYRISRNVSLSSDILYKYLIPNGVNLICFDASIDISTPEGQENLMTFGMRGQAQLQYIGKTSMRSKRTLAESGGYSGKPPYGWKMASREHNEVVRVEDQIKVIQRIFDEYAGGKSIGKIIRELQEDKIARPLAKNCDWSIGDVGRLLRKRQYIGEICFQKKHYPSPYVPIIERTVWDHVQKLLSENNKLPKRSMTSPWLASGILRCGFCEDRKIAGGHVRFGNLHAAIATNGVKKEYPFFKCGESARYRKKVCPGVTISVSVIDEFLREIVGYWAVSGVQNDIDTSPIDREIKEAEAKIQEMNLRKDALKNEFSKPIKQSSDLNAAMAGELAAAMAADLANLTRKLNMSIGALNRKIDECRNRVTAISNREVSEALDRLSNWDSLDTQKKRELLKKVIDRIVIYPDCLKVFTRMNPDRAAVFPIKKVWRTRMIITDQFDRAAMSMQIAVDFGSERPEDK